MTYDRHRNNPDVHYRLYLDRSNNPVVICVQDFDYPDYDETRFLSPDAWNHERLAQHALKVRMEILRDAADRILAIPHDKRAFEDAHPILREMVNAGLIELRIPITSPLSPDYWLPTDLGRAVLEATR